MRLALKECHQMGAKVTKNIDTDAHAPRCGLSPGLGTGDRPPGLSVGDGVLELADLFAICFASPAAHGPIKTPMHPREQPLGLSVTAMSVMSSTVGASKPAPSFNQSFVLSCANCSIPSCKVLPLASVLKASTSLINSQTPSEHNRSVSSPNAVPSALRSTVAMSGSAQRPPM